MIKFTNPSGWLVRKVPDPPRNVRAVLLDGTEIPIELAYVGVVGGVQTWEQVRPGPIPMSVFHGARVDELPENTAIAIDVDEER